MLKKLKTDDKVVGTKQVKRAILQNTAKKVFIAKDAEERIVSEIKKECRKKAIDIDYVDTMKELGEACGIEVSAATAALLK